MPTRQEDWMAQAERDLKHALMSLREGHYEWACFAAHQAAEKALKAVYQKLGGEARGHSLFRLLSGLSPRLNLPEGLEGKTKELDKNYIPTRYPDAIQEGAPFEVYTKGEAEGAIKHAQSIIEFCKRNLVGP